LSYDSVWTAALALQKVLTKHFEQGMEYFDYSRKDLSSQIFTELENLEFTGISGPISFHGADRIGNSIFHQFQGE